MSRTRDLALLAVAGGGTWLAYQIFSLDEEIKSLRNLIDRTEEDINAELDEEVDESTLQAHEESYSSVYENLYDTSSDEIKEDFSDPDSIDEQLEGEDLEHRSLFWKYQALGIAGINEIELAGESSLDDFAWILVSIGIGAAGVGVGGWLASKSISYVRRNPPPPGNTAMSMLGTVEFLNYLDDQVADDPEMAETFTPEPQQVPGGVSDEPHPSEGDVVAEVPASDVISWMPQDIADDVTAALNVDSIDAVVVTEGAIEILAEVTNKTQSYYESLEPIHLAAIVLVLVAAVVLLLAPELITDAMGYALLAAQSLMWGIRVSVSALLRLSTDLFRAVAMPAPV